MTSYANAWREPFIMTTPFFWESIKTTWSTEWASTSFPIKGASHPFEDHSNRRYYGGSFRNDLIHGHGVLIYENGDRYEGNFENGVKSGKGAYFFKEGSVYRGRFAEDAFEGHGVLTSASGGKCKLMPDFYKGQFKKGKYTGVGRLRFAQGVYQGNFINGFFEGYGRIHQAIWPNSTGSATKAISKMIFFMVRIRLLTAGYGALRYPNKDLYLGNFSQGAKCGKGTYIHSDLRVVGEFDQRDSFWMINRTAPWPINMSNQSF